MLTLPEYLLFAAPPSAEGAVLVKVHIDGRPGMIRSQHMSPEGLEDFLCDARGEMPFLAFDEYPKRFVTFRLNRVRGSALLSVRSLEVEDAFPQEWETRGPKHADDTRA